MCGCCSIPLPRKAGEACTRFAEESRRKLGFREVVARLTDGVFGWYTGGSRTRYNARRDVRRGGIGRVSRHVNLAEW